uniref:Uncharacterized protein n=1 Tax=viral metagenome TaxID=1070528 RepID=A0A6C0J2S9_9ZZZZ
MLDFAYIDNSEIIKIPSQNNKGLYSGEEAINDTKIIPNAENYSSQFFSKNILPYDDRNSKRYGNSSLGSR